MDDGDDRRAFGRALRAAARWGRRVGAVLVVLVPAALYAVQALSVFPAAAPGPAAPRSVACAPQGWSDAARQLEAVDADRAEAVYRAVLAKVPTDVCAVEGLGRIATAQQAAAAADAAGAGLPKRVGAAWKGLLESRLQPLAPVVLAGFGVLVTLLVLARLATASLTWPGSVVRRPALVDLAGWVGLSLCALAATMSVFAGPPTFGVPAANAKPFLDFAGLRVTTSTPTALVLAAAAVLGLAGVVALAASRGRALRVAVEVRGSDGKVDDPASADVLQRLHEFGTARPVTLRTVSDPDVTTLPDDALTAVPEGALAKALFTLLRVLRPAVPWRARVDLVDDRVTVSVTRNGRATGETRRTTRQELLAGAGGDSMGEEVLRVFAAAAVLLTLAEHHETLRRGLCGSTHPGALTRTVLAARLDDAHARPLLDAALARDPDSGLVRYARLARLGMPRGETAAQVQALSTVEALVEAELAGPELGTSPGAKGWEVLRLRYLWLLTATRLNRARSAPATVPAHDEDTARRWMTSAAELVEGLSSSDDDLARLRRTSALPVAFLVLDLDHVLGVARGGAGAPADLLPGRWRAALDKASTLTASVVRPGPVAPDAPAEPGLLDPVVRADAAYARACHRALTQDTSRVLLRVVADLKIAVTAEALREWAVHDPYFGTWRDTAAFRAVVGRPAKRSFVELAAVAAGADRLRALGVDDAASLLRLSAVDVAERCDLPLPVVRRWFDLARLLSDESVPGRPGATALPVAFADAVVEQGVTSRAALMERVRAGYDDWHRAVVAATASLDTVPDHGVWASCTGISAPSAGDGI